MALELSIVPSLDTDPATLATWWVETGQYLNVELGKIRDRITDHMVISGRDLPGLGVTFTHAYAPDAAAEFPELVKAYSLSAQVGDQQTFDRLVELVVEQVPDAVVKSELKLDNVKANTIINRAGEGSDRLRELRNSKPRLVVK